MPTTANPPKPITEPSGMSRTASAKLANTLFRAMPASCPSPLGDRRVALIAGSSRVKPGLDAWRDSDGSPAGRSVQPVKAHRAAGHDLVLGLGRQALEALAHHVRRAGEEAVGVRVIGRPHDLV